MTQVGQINSNEPEKRWAKVKRVARKAPREMLQGARSIVHHLAFVLVGALGVLLMRGHATGAFNDSSPNTVWYLSIFLLTVAASGIYDRGYDRGKTKGLEDVIDTASEAVKLIAERQLHINIRHTLLPDLEAEELSVETEVAAVERRPREPAVQS